MTTEIVGSCQCPLCKAADAAVKIGAKGKHFINCDACCSLIRTMSREGNAAIVGMMVTTTAAAAPTTLTVGDKKDAPPVEVKKDTSKPKRGALDAALSALGGRS